MTVDRVGSKLTLASNLPPGPGWTRIKNLVFGGDGTFLARLTGPGKVWLQTFPCSASRAP